MENGLVMLYHALYCRNFHSLFHLGPALKKNTMEAGFSPGTQSFASSFYHLLPLSDLKLLYPEFFTIQSKFMVLLEP